jgi:hypothetical protein
MNETHKTIRPHYRNPRHTSILAFHFRKFFEIHSQLEIEFKYNNFKRFHFQGSKRIEALSAHYASNKLLPHLYLSPARSKMN